MIKIKQYNIDNGFIGGIVNTFTGSMYIFSPLNFIMTASVFYKLVLGNKLAFSTFIMVLIPAYLVFLWIHFTIIYPSMLKQVNRQACMHGNPVMDELKQIRKQLDGLHKK
jgi:hypothetical protein